MNRMQKMAVRGVLLLTVFLVIGCGARTEERVVRLDRVDPDIGAKDRVIAGQNPLRVAVSSVLSLKETLMVYQPMLEYLEQKTNRPVVLLQRKTYKEVNDLLQGRTADIAFVCSGGYVAGYQGFGMELLAVPLVKGENTYQSYIIANSGNSATGLAELRGRSFAFTDPMSFSGRIAPVHMLEQAGYSLEKFFSRTFFTYSHDNSIQAVAGGIVEAAAVDSMIYDRALEKNPDLKKTTRIIARSLSVGNPPVVVAPGMDPAWKRSMQELFLRMQDEPSGKAALASLEYERFIEPDAHLYEGLMRIWLVLREKL